MFEVDDENERTVISTKLKKRDAECHIDGLRIDEDDNSRYIYIECCSRLLNSQKKSKFRKSLTFANIVIMVLELKKYSTNIMIRDVWKLKDNK